MIGSISHRIVGGTVAAGLVGADPTVVAAVAEADTERQEGVDAVIDARAHTGRRVIVSTSTIQHGGAEVHEPPAPEGQRAVGQGGASVLVARSAAHSSPASLPRAVAARARQRVQVVVGERFRVGVVAEPAAVMDTKTPIVRRATGVVQRFKAIVEIEDLRCREPLGRLGLSIDETDHLGILGWIGPRRDRNSDGGGGRYG